MGRIKEPESLASIGRVVLNCDIQTRDNIRRIAEIRGLPMSKYLREHSIKELNNLQASLIPGVPAKTGGGSSPGGGSGGVSEPDMVSLSRKIDTALNLFYHNPALIRANDWLLERHPVNYALKLAPSALTDAEIIATAKAIGSRLRAAWQIITRGEVKLYRERQI